MYGGDMLRKEEGLQLQCDASLCVILGFSEEFLVDYRFDLSRIHISREEFFHKKRRYLNSQHVQVLQLTRFSILPSSPHI